MERDCGGVVCDELSRGAVCACRGRGGVLPEGADCADGGGAVARLSGFTVDAGGKVGVKRGSGGVVRDELSR